MTSRADRLRSDIAKKQAELDQIEARPADIYPDLTVLRFQLRWLPHDSPPSAWFNYTALKIHRHPGDPALWYVGGANPPLVTGNRKTWDSLMAWWERNEVRGVERATQWVGTAEDELIPPYPYPHSAVDGWRHSPAKNPHDHHVHISLKNPYEAVSMSELEAALLNLVDHLRTPVEGRSHKYNVGRKTAADEIEELLEDM